MSEFIDNTTVIEVEETPINPIGLTTNQHDLLTNRFEPDQHSIGAITGLSEKLEEIQELKNFQPAKGKGYAEYWRWHKDASIPQYPGIFVRLTQDGENMCIDHIMDRTDNIFGVTVSKDDVAFIGNEELTPIQDAETNAIVGYESTRDNQYALVCLVGAVKVRYESYDDIRVGDYIKPASYGVAEKADAKDGYYRVCGVGSDLYGKYVIINLSLSASDVDNISVKHAKTADDYTDDGTIKQAIDDLNNKIETEIDNIQNGATIVGVAKNFDTTEGTIKEEFDDIKDGTTVVAHASNADYINIKNVEDDVTKPCSIQTCTAGTLESITYSLTDTIYVVTDDTSIEDMTEMVEDCIASVEDLVDWKTAVDEGTTPVERSYADSEGTNIRSNYYILDMKSENIITGGDLNNYVDPGVYVIDELAAHNGDIENLCGSFGNYSDIKLIVEINEQGLRYVRQTLRTTYLSDDVGRASYYMYMRNGTLDEFSKTYIWTEWDSVVMRGDIGQSNFTVARATGDAAGHNIQETYVKKEEVDDYIDEIVARVTGPVDLTDTDNCTCTVGSILLADLNRYTDIDRLRMFSYFSSPNDMYLFMPKAGGNYLECYNTNSSTPNGYLFTGKWIVCGRIPNTTLFLIQCVPNSNGGASA